MYADSKSRTGGGRRGRDHIHAAAGANRHPIQDAKRAREGYRPSSGQDNIISPLPPRRVAPHDPVS